MFLMITHAMNSDISVVFSKRVGKPMNTFGKHSVSHTELINY